jgi:osmotically-inducible protein OsmY
VSFHVAAGIVTLHGGLSDDRQRTAIRILAETVPGVKKVQDKMIVIQPMMVGLL